MNQPTTNPQFAELLERLAAECEVAFDRVVAKRAVQEAQRGWPGPEEDRWWQWLVEAGNSIGLRVRAVELTLERALESTSTRPLALYLANTPNPWMLIYRQRKGRFHIITAETGREGRWVSRGALTRLLGDPPPDTPLRWVVVEPAVTCQPAEVETPEEHRPPMTPLRRLWAILAAEGPDIRTILILALFVGLLTLTTPLAIEILVSTVAFGRTLQPIIVLALLLLMFLTFSAIVQAVEKYVVELIQRRLFVRIAAEVAHRLPRVRRDALDGKSAPELANRFFDIVTVQKVVATLLVDVLDLLMVTVTGMLVLALYHPMLLAVDLILMALVLFMLFVLGQGGVRSSIAESKGKYAMAAWLEGLGRCAHAVKQEGGSEFALEHADRIARKYLIARQTHFRILFRQIVFSLGLYAVSSAVLLGVGGLLVIQGQLSIGQLVAAELIITIILGSITKLSKHLESYYDLMASVDKLGVLIDLPLERQDGLLSLPGEGGLAVRLRDVCYRYGEGPMLLQHLSFTVAPGKCLGISGPAASGKTTLTELLFGLRRPTSGNLELNGVDSEDLRPDILRHHVALVGPVEIFDGTIAENVHLDRVLVDSTDVHRVLQQVGLLDDVFLLPQGLETPLTASGAPLSETQVRRLMLARAIAGRPRLLIVDSLLDTMPDQDAVELLTSLRGEGAERTLIVVSARRPILEACDHLLSLGHGSAEMATWSKENA